MSTAAMRGAGIQGPGVVLGLYPERQVPAKPLPGGGWLARLLAAGGAHAAFARRVREARDALGEVPLTREAWRERVALLRMRLARDGLHGEALVEAFACVVLACEHTLRLAPFDTQIIAARILLDNQLAEMATGEGKTLAAALAAAVAAWAGVPVHVITANDYLVERDHATLNPLYQALGLTAGAVVQPLDMAARRAAYACDITYCTAKELAFDYLRDGLVSPRRSVPEQSAAALAQSTGIPAGAAGGPDAGPLPLLRGLNMAIVDEADSVLIDEARVPLILSQPAPQAATSCVAEAWRLSQALHAGVHFAVDAEARAARLTPAGHAVLLAAGRPGISWLNALHRGDLVTLALTARHVLRAGRDYVVDGGRVHIVDETTGRKAEGRAWSNGLQQLVELAAGCATSPALTTVAQMTFQRFFRRYLRLCGMSGTLTEARGELYRLYGLAVVPVAPRLPSRRAELPPRAFATTAAQWQAVVMRVRELRALGRPVLIGTDSVLASEALSRCLAANDISHAVLNAVQDSHEAAVIARAGRADAVTVATQLAGRGTDILLDAASRAAGGLHVICCQQNAERRVQRQLMGRSARQGDPGSCELFIAWDGPLLGAYRFGAGKTPAGGRQGYGGAMARTAQAALAYAQRTAARGRRREREALLRRDEQINDMLAFSGMSQ